MQCMAANPREREAATVEALLPEELMTEILLRLPVKALLKFKCVSKQLRSLISRANFVERYLQEGFNRRVLLSSSHCLRLQSLDYEALISNHDENSALENLKAPPQMGSNRPAQVLGSCYGLVSISMGLGEKIAIWNPSLGHYRIIQETSLIGSYGFGYDCFADDYKLIKLFAQKGSKETDVDVFSLRANSWRSIRYEHLNLNLVDKVGTFASGSISWLVKKYSDGKIVASVISFDVSKEKFCHVPLPECGYIEGWRLGILGGCLSACYSVFGKDAEVWMKEGTDAEISCWVKLGSVPQAEEAEYIRDDLMPLCFASNGGALMIKGGFKLYVCNLRKKTCKRIYFYDDPNEFEGALFVESLVSPNDYGAQVQKDSMNEDDILEGDKEDSKVEKFTHISV